MNHYACPRCGKSLRFRLLPHVPLNRGQGRIAFSCIHCGAVLTYTEPTSRLHRWMWSTPWRRVITYLSMLVLSGVTSRSLGKGGLYAVLGLFALVLLLSDVFPRRSAYRLVEPASTGPHHRGR